MSHIWSFIFQKAIVNFSLSCLLILALHPPPPSHTHTHTDTLRVPGELTWIMTLTEFWQVSHQWETERERESGGGRARCLAQLMINYKSQQYVGLYVFYQPCRRHKHPNNLVHAPFINNVHTHAIPETFSALLSYLKRDNPGNDLHSLSFSVSHFLSLS